MCGGADRLGSALGPRAEMASGQWGRVCRNSVPAESEGHLAPRAQRREVSAGGRKRIWGPRPAAECSCQSVAFACRLYSRPVMCLVKHDTTFRAADGVPATRPAWGPAEVG